MVADQLLVESAKQIPPHSSCHAHMLCKGLFITLFDFGIRAMDDMNWLAINYVTFIRKHSTLAFRQLCRIVFCTGRAHLLY